MVRFLRILTFAALPLLTISCSGGKPDLNNSTNKAELVKKNFIFGKDFVPGSFSIGFPRTAIPLSHYELPAGIKDGLLYDLRWKKPTPGETPKAGMSEPKPFSALRSRKEIWIDWNRDDKFSPGEKQEGVARASGKNYYRPTGAPPGSDFDGVFFGYAGAEDHAKGSVEKWITINPSFYYEGQLSLGSMRVAIKIVDGNLDGRLGQGQGFAGSGDTLAVDYNRDGIAVVADPMSASENVESMPLRTNHIFPDGKYYVVKVSDDCKTMSLVPDPTPTGTISIPLDVVGPLGFSQGPEFHAVPLMGGKVTLRSGQYELGWLRYLVKDDKGNRWEMSMRQPAQRYFSVSPGSNDIIESEPPYTASCKAEVQQGRQIIYLWINDSKRNAVLPMQGRDAPLTRPNCQIQSESGKVVHEGEMTYWGGDYILSWSPPKSTAGIFNVGIRWKLPLWGELQTSTRFKL